MDRVMELLSVVAFSLLAFVLSALYLTPEHGMLNSLFDWIQSQFFPDTKIASLYALRHLVMGILVSILVVALYNLFRDFPVIHPLLPSLAYGAMAFVMLCDMSNLQGYWLPPEVSSQAQVVFLTLSMAGVLILSLTLPWFAPSLLEGVDACSQAWTVLICPLIITVLFLDWSFIPMLWRYCFG